MRIFNMIISLEREDDRKTLEDIVDISDISLRAYIRTEDYRFLPNLEWLNETIDRLRKKIDSYDYTKDDQMRKRVDELLNYEIK